MPTWAARKATVQIAEIRLSRLDPLDQFRIAAIAAQHHGVDRQADGQVLSQPRIDRVPDFERVIDVHFMVDRAVEYGLALSVEIVHRVVRLRSVPELRNLKRQSLVIGLGTGVAPNRTCSNRLSSLAS